LLAFLGALRDHDARLSKFSEILGVVRDEGAFLNESSMPDYNYIVNKNLYDGGRLSVAANAEIGVSGCTESIAVGANAGADSNGCLVFLCEGCLGLLAG